MATISTVAILKLAFKTALFIAGVLGVASGMNYLHSKKFKKAGVKNEIDAASETVIHTR